MVKMLKNLSQRSYFPLLILFVVCGLICILALRHNNTQMIRLRDRVYVADKAGGDVNAALNQLRGYVYGHMNTDLSTGTSVKPPIQLPYTYQRLQDTAEHDANSTSLYTDAENYCQAQIPASESISGRGRIGCVTDYITSHGGQQAATVPTSLYEFDFASPKWSPDLAGWSLVASVISGLSLAISFLAHRAGRDLPTI